MGILLASSSPRRRELLERAGLVFRVVASPAEEIHDETMEPWRLCEENALLKARAVAVDHPDEVVIGADTLVFSDGRALGKPRDLEDARRMLRALSGKTHRVCTGVCLIFPGGVEDVFHDLTEVVFREFGDEVIGGYFAKVDPLDKAGAYGIQEHGEMLVSEIRGSFENVMGLPVGMVVERLMSASPDLRTAEG
ncbi:MAG: septum formation protein Maf [Akkermansiaceae bacterium]|nr:septum formation protein Maf [Akkermansiaceae bacterium]